MSRIDAIQQYNAAYRHGVKFYNTCIAQGKSPYPPVLDDIANETQISGQQVIGIVEIPLNLVVGTLAAGRKSAFAGNFKPILPDNSEFAENGSASRRRSWTARASATRSSASSSWAASTSSRATSASPC